MNQQNPQMFLDMEWGRSPLHWGLREKFRQEVPSSARRVFPWRAGGAAGAVLLRGI